MSCSLSTKLQAEYADLVNQYLDHIPIASVNEFSTVADALGTITDPKTSRTVPNGLKERISSIQELLDQPELYVENKKDYAAYRKVILDRVAAKVRELSSMTLAEKERYMAEGHERKERTAHFQNITVSARPPAPNSEAHTISDEQWLAEEQARFNRTMSTLGVEAEMMMTAIAVAGLIDHLRQTLQSGGSGREGEDNASESPLLLISLENPHQEESERIVLLLRPSRSSR